jgi:8-hydroxy-5-deazaflavin:NADPH oxidoreductase
MKVAIIGGTGTMGRELARKLSKNYEVVIGSRDSARAKATAMEVAGAIGTDYHGAAEASDVVIFAIPYEAIRSVAPLAPDVSGKLVISMINPMRMEGELFVYDGGAASAAEELAHALPGSKVATAFNNVPPRFFEMETVPPVDVLVAADSKETFEEAAKLVRSIREMRPMHAGPLSHAKVVESITPLVLNLSRLNGTGALATRFVTRKG